jgi:tetratricopeptide (TPR) repeat protein
MDIGDQYAKGDIYNIAKLDLNGGTLKADAVYLNATAQEASFFAQEAQSVLNAQFSISYLDFIIADAQKKFLIERKILDELRSALSNKSDLPLTGVPGAGKTCLFFALSKEITNVVYLPLKGRTLLSIVAHLVNKINLAAGLPLLNITDSDAGLEILQGLLASSRITFMLDDCESNPEVVDKLLPLRKLENRFIYASRNEQGFIAKGVEPFKVASFSFEEVKEFLEGSNISLEVMTMNDLFEASNGNPLYLYYFTQFQISPLPKDITDYHQAIWGSLTPKQQQCLIYIALSYRPMIIKVINDLIPFEFPTETAGFINSLIALVKNENGLFEIFHPAFKEFIISWLDSSQLTEQYRNELGSYYLKQGDNLQATHLLLENNPEALQNIAYEVAHQLVNEGDLTFAIKVMQAMLQFAKTNFENGYLHYHLSFNYKMLYDNKNASYHQEQSLEYFGKLKQRTWYNLSLMNKAVSLVEDGKTQEGIAIADQVLEKSKSYGSAMEGQLLVNVSKMYVDIHENEKAAKASLRAYQSFEKKEYLYGMLSSLVNLASALAKLNDYDDVAAKYALKLLDYTEAGVSFNLELIALNILTSVNRQKGNFKEAKAYGHKAVMLCQHYKLENKAILNLINYGNVLRDAGEITECLAVYHEALIATNRLGLKKDESRIYWILAGIYFEKEDYTKAIEHIDISITRSKEINYNYGIAHGYEDRAKICKKIGDFNGAAENFALSAISFQTLNDFSKNSSLNLQKAILLYLELGLKEEANNLLKDSVKILQQKGFPNLSVLVNAPYDDLDIHNYFKTLTVSYLQQEEPNNLTFEYISYLEYCLAHVKTSQQQFGDLLKIFAENPDKNRFAKTILAMLLEQSKVLTDGNDLKVLLKLLSSTITGFYAREIAHETIILLKLPNNFKLEIICYTEDILTLKLALGLTLYFTTSPDLLLIDKPPKQDFCKIQIMMLKDFKKVLPKVKISELDGRISTYHLQKNGYDISNYIVVAEKYERSADLIIDQNNKHFLYFIGATIKTLVVNFYHVKYSLSDRLTRPVTRKLAFYMGLTGIEEIRAQKEAYSIDLEKLDRVFNKHIKQDAGTK